MNNKDQANYELVLRALLDLVSYPPETVMVDFEVALHNAINIVFLIHQHLPHNPLKQLDLVAVVFSDQLHQRQLKAIQLEDYLIHFLRVKPLLPLQQLRLLLQLLVQSAPVVDCLPSLPLRHLRLKALQLDFSERNPRLLLFSRHPLNQRDSMVPSQKPHPRLEDWVVLAVPHFLVKPQQAPQPLQVYSLQLQPVKHLRRLHQLHLVPFRLV